MQTSGNSVFVRRRLAVMLACTLSSGLAQAADTVLDTIEVTAKGNPDAEIVQPDASTPATLYKVDREAMRLFDTPGGSNPYTAVAEVPGVKITTLGAYGMDNLQGGQKGMRVRGEVVTHGAYGTVEGLALYGPGPGPGYLFLFDKENIRQVDIAQGPVNADRSGLFNNFGSLDTKLRWPEAQAGGEIGFSMGQSNFLRSFVRADSGRLSTGAAFFVSASKTQAEKWRGTGDAPGARNNVEIGFSQELGSLKINLIYANNQQKQHSYRGLTYAEASDLDRYRYFDYGDNAQSADYYNYNRQEFRNQALLGEISYTVTPDTVFTFKPFYAKEEGSYTYQGSTATQVMQWLIDHKSWGATGELRTRLAGTEFKLGHAWSTYAPPGPPTNQKMYSVASSEMVFTRWARLSQLTDRHEFHNTYLTAQSEFDALTLTGGIRHFRETLPGIIAYNTAPTNGSSWNVSAKEAAARATEDQTRSVDSRTLIRWLPNLGASYRLPPAAELRVNVGQTVGGPSLDVFQSSAASVVRPGWNHIKLELATGIDIGAHIRLDDAYLDPTFYYSRSKNKGVSVYDPALGQTYSQNVGKTAAMGFQLASGWSLTRTLQLVSALSYSRSKFTENVQTAAGTTLDVKGKQLPDVPRWMGNLGAIWRHQGFTVSPMLQYVGPRWVTSDYAYQVPGYWVTDLSIGYEQKTGWGNWSATVGVVNLFDRAYIGQISVSEISTTAGNRVLYPGAPRTVFASVNLGF